MELLFYIFMFIGIATTLFIIGALFIFHVLYKSDLQELLEDDRVHFWED